jgi:hypothetical protein
LKKAARPACDRAKLLKKTQGMGIVADTVTQNETPQAGNPPADWLRCSNCGSKNIRKTGETTNAAFADKNVKDTLFICDACGHVSAFLLP